MLGIIFPQYTAWTFYNYNFITPDYHETLLEYYSCIKKSICVDYQYI